VRRRDVGEEGRKVGGGVRRREVGEEEEGRVCLLTRTPARVRQCSARDAWGVEEEEEVVVVVVVEVVVVVDLPILKMCRLVV